MLKTSKWSTWWDSLPAHTKEYLEAQPIWHNKDVVMFVSTAFVIGFIVGGFIG
jgi:hypothetical protein